MTAPYPEAGPGAADAIRAAYEAAPLIPRRTIDAIVAAAAPHIERAVREQVAADIEAEAQRRGNVGHRCLGLADAARIARGQS